MISTAAAAQDTLTTEQARISVSTIAEGSIIPGHCRAAGRRHACDGALGRFAAYNGGKVGEPSSGVPEVDARDQGGLLDITLHPKFTENRAFYVSFSEKGEGGNSTAVVRGTLSEDNRNLENVQVIFSQKPKVDSMKHFGSRIVFDPEGKLYVGLGERSDEEFRGQAQDLNSHLGKVVRLNDDGSVPQDNPFVGHDDALPEICSYGHRNIQAAAIHPDTGTSGRRPGR